MTFSELLDLHPNLTANGWRVGAKDDKYEEDRAYLVRGYENVERARQWMSERKKTKHTTKTGSYWLKHVLEREQKQYITNGEFIAGAILAGFTPNRHSDGPNCSFNISRREIKKHMRDVKLHESDIF